MTRKILISLLLCSQLIIHSTASESLSPELQGKINSKLEQLKVLGSDEIVIREVKHLTANPPVANMTNEKWKSITLISPEVKTLAKNTLATYLKSKKDESITELFVSDSAGNKIAFFSKPSGFCHKGKAKHDVPMTGKMWVGEVELDESTGIQQIQVSFPVFDGKKPVGSIVIGLALAKL